MCGCMQNDIINGKKMLGNTSVKPTAVRVLRYNSPTQNKYAYVFNFYLFYDESYSDYLIHSQLAAAARIFTGTHIYFM